ncbi:MAG TPA: tetratricopeptide repeat protein [Parachlamydiaceae bacterium]|nr:tetratricopeptide repeat protein [Parachlamydiaceae bacterium]
MTISNLDYKIAHSYTKCASDNEIKKAIDPLFPKFDRLLAFYIKFNLLFFFLMLAEIAGLFLSFRFLADSALLAFSFGLLFLTIFSYFILRFYFQTQKPVEFEKLKNSYERSCKLMFGYEETNIEKHVTLANAYCKLANSLHKKEAAAFKLPKILTKTFPFLALQAEKFSAWCLFEDVHKMKELLLIGAVEEHIKVVKCEPASQVAHAALANAYVMLSGLYAAPDKLEPLEAKGKFKSFSSAISSSMEQKFRLTAERAIEEFKIILDYAPDDPWIHKQLAYSYHDLQMPIEEIKEYEAVLKINPDDRDTLYKLGVLYFQQGFNAKGLRLYEKLKQFNQKKADQLIKFYAAYSPF